MQITMAITALMLSAGFIFWVAVLSNMVGDSEVHWAISLSLAALTVTAVGFAFMAGLVW